MSLERHAWVDGDAPAANLAGRYSVAEPVRVLVSSAVRELCARLRRAGDADTAGRGCGVDGDARPDYALLDRAGGGSVFFPRADGFPPPTGASDHLIEVEPGIAVAARFYASDPSLPTILYFHGNGEIASDHDDIAPLYHEARTNLFVAEFRGYGKSGGQPSLASVIADCRPIVESFHATLDQQGFDARRFVMGRSLGTHAALEIAARHAGRLRGLIVESGAANIRRMLGRLGLDDTREGEALADLHEAKVRSIRLPTLLLHGEVDELVPVGQSAVLYDLLSETDRELVVIPGAGHNDILWRGLDQYFEAIVSLVQKAR